MSVSNKKNKPSILIVDDERGTREVLAKFLRADYEVTLAEDGEIGLNLLKRNHYDLVLSDIPYAGRDRNEDSRSDAENDAASAVHSLYRLRLH